MVAQPRRRFWPRWGKEDWSEISLILVIVLVGIPFAYLLAFIASNLSNVVDWIYEFVSSSPERLIAVVGWGAAVAFGDALRRTRKEMGDLKRFVSEDEASALRLALDMDRSNRLLAEQRQELAKRDLLFDALWDFVPLEDRSKAAVVLHKLRNSDDEVGETPDLL